MELASIKEIYKIRKGIKKETKEIEKIKDNKFKNDI